MRIFGKRIRTRLNAFSPRPRANPTSKGIFQFDYGETGRTSTSLNMFQLNYDDIG